MWYVYLIRTASGSLYTGITVDVERRFLEHASGPRGARSLRGKGPLELVFSAEAGNRSQALKLEYHLKRWPAARKRALIRGDVPLPDLAHEAPAPAPAQS